VRDWRRGPKRPWARVAAEDALEFVEDNVSWRLAG
jgi:hypothetical protein